MKYNLNELSHDTALVLIQTLLETSLLNITEVYIDTVGDPEKYQKKLEAHFPKLKIRVTKKADANFLCVSAASICAKVARDRILKDWRLLEKIFVPEYGSGYPGGII